METATAVGVGVGVLFSIYFPFFFITNNFNFLSSGSDFLESQSQERACFYFSFSL
jgi:hypothetical protein